MKLYYCWRCKTQMPMLEEDEWALLEPLLVEQLKQIKAYRAEHMCDLKTGIANAYKPATEKYQQITGYHEPNSDNIYHHRLSIFGPECKQCGHLLRTPKASFCANCGLSVSESNQ